MSVHDVVLRVGVVLVAVVLDFAIGFYPLSSNNQPDGRTDRQIYARKNHISNITASSWRKITGRQTCNKMA